MLRLSAEVNLHSANPVTIVTLNLNSLSLYVVSLSPFLHFPWPRLAESLLILLLSLSVSEEKLNLDESEWEDIHVITGALKLFFRELPEPLVPYGFFTDIVETVSE